MVVERILSRNGEQSEEQSEEQTEEQSTYSERIKLPHERSLSNIIIDIRRLFFKTLEMLIDKKNPIKYIFSTERRQFALAVFLIIIGTLLLLLSNLFRSN